MKLKSTIQKSFEKKSLQNGEVEISFQKPSPFMFFSMFAGIFIIGAIFANSYQFGWLGWFVVPGYIFGCYSYLKSRKEKIFVIPRVGIKFGKDQLPFNEMNKIGVKFQNNFARVYAVSNGTEVNLTSWVQEELANALQKEIMTTSEITWG